MIVGEYIADFCDRLDNEGRHPDEARPRIPAARAGEARRVDGRRGTEDASAIKASMQDLMTAKVGIFRRGEDLEAAVEELQTLAEEEPQQSASKNARVARIPSSSPRTGCRRC
jgi:fumarate reductase flavoprotein subunit